METFSFWYFARARICASVSAGALDMTAVCCSICRSKEWGRRLDIGHSKMNLVVDEICTAEVERQLLCMRSAVVMRSTLREERVQGGWVVEGACVKYGELPITVLEIW